jgi:hypothetical protein
MLLGAHVGTIVGVRFGRLAVVAATIACGAAFASSAAACTRTWASPTSGAWTDAAAWNPVGAPTATDDVCLPATGTYTVTLAAVPGGGATIASISVGDAGAGAPTLVIRGSSVPSGFGTQQYSELTATNGGAIASNGTLVLDTTDEGMTATAGDVAGGSAILAGGTLLNNGTILTQSEAIAPIANQRENVLRASIVNEPSGILRVVSGTLRSDSGTTFENRGTVDCTERGTWSMEPDATRTTVPIRFVNAGMVVTDGGNSLIDGAVWTQAGGAVTSTDDEPIWLQGSSLDYQSGSGHFWIDIDLHGQPSTLSGMIPAGSSVTIAGASVQLLGASVVNRGDLTVRPFQTPHALSAPAVLTGAPLDNYGTLAVTNDLMDGGTGGATATNATYLRANLTNEPGARLELASSSLVQDGGTSFTNSGTLVVQPDQVYTLSANLSTTARSTFTNTESGTIELRLSPASVGLIKLATGSTLHAGGSIDAIASPGSTPVVGRSYRLVDGKGGTFDGSFARVSGGISLRSAKDGSIALTYGATASKPTAGSTRITIVGACPANGPSCGRIDVDATAIVRTRTTVGKKRKVVIRTRTVVVGRVSATVMPGASKRITLVLNATGRRLLARASRTLAVGVTVTSAGRVLVHSTVALRAP